MKPPICSLAIALALPLLAGPGIAQTSAASSLVISGNEAKIDLQGGQKLIPNPAPDSLSILDFSSFPPKVTELPNVPNSVIGPPSNIAINPDATLALIANSINVTPGKKEQYEPAHEIHILDLEQNPPAIIGHLNAGAQPSGISFTPDGKSALVANRADGTVTVLSVSGKKVEVADTIRIGKPEDSFSDVAIHPNGSLALVSAQKGGYLALLTQKGGKWTSTGRKLSVFGQPYRVVITPDGTLGLTAGAGFGNGPDNDAISIIDLAADPIKTIGYAAIGSSPESFEISPDSKVLAAVVMNGSNLNPQSADYHKNGTLEILRRKGKQFSRTQSLPVGAIPEGVAFTPDGHYIIVQCHPEKELWIFELRGNRVRNTGHVIKVPGMPSSIRAAR